MRPCESCDGTGESEKWNEASGVYHDCPCFHCNGTGEVKEDKMDERQETRCASCGNPYNPSVMKECVEGTDVTLCEECYLDMVFGEPRHEEANDFDKFMDVTLLKETRQATHDVEGVHPQRRVARKYQENPLGRITYGAKR